MIRVFHHRRGAFTLVELLTVVGIIALLIGILIPSLTRARDQAKRVKTSATISAIDKGLQMFFNDFGQYPDSSVKTLNKSGTYVNREDPITGFPDAGTNEVLTGAHWLCRAIAGADFTGMDSPGYAMRARKDIKSTTGPPPTITVVSDDTGTGMDMATVYQAAKLDRKGIYMENVTSVCRRDTHLKFNQTGSPNTGRSVIFDAFDGPIIYYRANPRAQRAFCATAADTNGLGIYNHDDNAKITGTTGPNPDDTFLDTTAWQFVPGVPNHVLGQFGANPYVAADVRAPKRFINFLRDPNVDDMSGGLSIKPNNVETYLLIAPGKDGRFGTDDDVTNFKAGGGL